MIAYDNGAQYFPYTAGIVMPVEASDDKAITSYVPACDHSYEWMIENEPTEDATGLMVEKCTKCGSIRSTQVIPAIKDDYDRSMSEKAKQILRAKTGQTVDTALDYYGPEKLIRLYDAKEVKN